MLAYGEGKKTVSSRHAQAAAADTPGTETLRGMPWKWMSAAVLFFAALSIAWVSYR
jgi:hypothetical protein